MISFTNKFTMSCVLAMAFLMFMHPANAKGVYQTEEDFLLEVFSGKVPDQKRLILKSKLREPIEKILKHPYTGMRIKYWQNNNQTAWVLEEIGKEYPITFGMVVSNGKSTQLLQGSLLGRLLMVKNLTEVLMVYQEPLCRYGQ
jgi:hypothetical protein